MRKFISITTNHVGEIFALDSEGTIWGRIKDPKWYGGPGIVPMIWQKLAPPDFEPAPEPTKEVKKNG